MNTDVRLFNPIRPTCTLVGLSLLALALLAAAPRSVAAQSAPQPTSAASDDSGAAPAASAEHKSAQVPPPPQPAPAAEGFKFGIYQGHSEFEVGYRLSSGFGGNQEMFRSQVNLFEGTRLLRSYLTLRSSPGTGLFDRLDLSLNNWGDPYNTLRFSLSRMDLYDFQASYRNLNYFNFISTFANPLLSTGNLFPQHNLNVNYRMSNFDLRLFPNHKIVPFVGYSRNSSSGPGFTTVEMPGNEFLLQTRWNYSADEYRGGIQFNFPILSLTLEQGYRRLKNDTGIVNDAQPQGNEGSRPFLGQIITLDSLGRGYHGRTKLPTSKALLKFTPFDNLRVTGRYMYSMGDLQSNFGEVRTGNFVSLEDFLSYGAAADTFSGRAKRPNHNASFLVEFSPFSRLTLSDNLDTLNYHISGAALLSTLFLDASSFLGTPGSTFTQSSLLDTVFSYNEVRNEANLELDLGWGFSARAGHRYTFVDAKNNDSEESHASDLSRHTALVGFVYRPGSWLRFGFDYENNQTNQPLTRTDLLNYDQFNLDWRTGSWKGLSFNGRIAVERNTNPAADIDFKSHNRNYIAGLSYQPNERFNLNLDYSRTNLFSDLLIVLPQNLRTDRSLFDERISGIGGSLGIGVYRGSRVELGYRGVINRGSFPIDYHQPFASLWIPLGHNVAFRPLWQFYQYTENQSGFENYKTHLLTFSLVFSR